MARGRKGESVRKEAGRGMKRKWKKVGGGAVPGEIEGAVGYRLYKCWRESERERRW